MNIKRIKALVLVCFFVFGVQLMMSETVLGEVYNSNGYTYLLNNNKASIYDINIGDTDKLIIPEYLDGYMVTSISNDAFLRYYNIKELSIPRDVKSIGKVLKNFSKLEKLSMNFEINPLSYYYDMMPVSLTSIEVKGNSIIESAFKNCVNIQNVVISDSVQKIGAYAFYGCEKLSSVSFGENVVEIGMFAFRNCVLLNNIELPSSVIKIKSKAFYNTAFCNDLSNWDDGVLISNSAVISAMNNNQHSLILPSNISCIADGCFMDVETLESIELTPNIRTIGESTFKNCKNLIELKHCNNITQIEDSAFLGCASLIMDWGFENLEIIESNAFKGCESLETVTIPNTVKKIGRDAFSGCSNITHLSLPYLGSSVDAYDSERVLGYLFGTTKYNNSYRVYGYYFIPNSLTHISIGYGDIAPNAMRDCSSLVNISLGSVSKIGNNAFSGCSSIISFTMPSSVNTIGVDAFLDCSSISSVYFTDINSMLSINYGNAFSNPCVYYANLYTNDKLVPEELTIDEVVSIKRYSIVGLKKLKRLNITGSVKTMAMYSVYDCPNLTYLYIGDDVIHDGGFVKLPSLQEIEAPYLRVYDFGREKYDGSYLCYKWDSAAQGSRTDFYVPSSLRKVTINVGSGIQNEISECALNNMQIEELYIGPKVKHIRTGAFWDCNKLKYVYISEGLIDIDLSYNSGNRKNGVFQGCSEIEEMVIPFVGGKSIYDDSEKTASTFGYIFGNMEFENSYSTETATKGGDIYAPHWDIPKSLKKVTVTTTKLEKNAFAGCEEIEQIILPSNIEKIPEHAFFYCKKLDGLILPDTVTSIDAYAFGECRSLTNITKMPPLCTEIAEGTFVRCYSLPYFEVTDNIKYIERHAFGECIAFNKLYIPKTVEYIGEGAFWGCANIEEVTLPFTGNSRADFVLKHLNSQDRFFGYAHARMLTCDNPNFLSSIFGGEGSEFVSAHNILGCRYKTKKQLEDALIGGYSEHRYHLYIHNDGSGGIPNKLKKVTLTGSTGRVSTVYREVYRECGGDSFFDWAGLETLILSDDVYEWPDIVKCTGLKVLVIGRGITKIPGAAFMATVHLETIYMPNSIKSLNSGSLGVKDIYYGGSLEEWDALGGFVYFPNATMHYNYDELYLETMQYASVVDDGIVTSKSMVDDEKIVVATFDADNRFLNVELFNTDEINNITFEKEDGVSKAKYMIVRDVNSIEPLTSFELSEDIENYEYSYQIEGVYFYDEFENEIELPRPKEEFTVDVDVSKIAGETTRDYIIFEAYDQYGEIVYRTYARSRMSVGGETTLTFNIPKQEKAIFEIRLFVSDSLTTHKMLSYPKCILW